MVMGICRKMGAVNRRLESGMSQDVLAWCDRLCIRARVFGLSSWSMSQVSDRNFCQLSLWWSVRTVLISSNYIPCLDDLSLAVKSLSLQDCSRFVK